MWLLGGSVAYAGVAAGVLGGLGAPLDVPTASSTGFVAGLYGGWRAELGPVDLQPELVVRLDEPPGVVVPAVGAAAALGGRLGVGAYAHLGVTLLGYPLPSPDAGLLAEVRVKPAVVGLRAGWAWDHPARYKCGNCPQPSEHWLQVAATAGVAF